MHSKDVINMQQPFRLNAGTLNTFISSSLVFHNFIDTNSFCLFMHAVCGLMPHFLVCFPQEEDDLRSEVIVHWPSSLSAAPPHPQLVISCGFDVLDRLWRYEDFCRALFLPSIFMSLFFFPPMFFPLFFSNPIFFILVPSVPPDNFNYPIIFFFFYVDTFINRACLCCSFAPQSLLTCRLLLFLIGGGGATAAWGRNTTSLLIV